MDPLRKGIAIGMLFGSEGSGNLMEKTAVENGVYTAAEEIDPDTGEIFDPPKDGYSVFTVDLPLDHKSVTITTSNITSSSGGVFNYDPHGETPELEGYDYFSVNLSGVKDDIEGMQARISDLEDELEEMQECCEDVAEILDAVPEQGETCCDAVKRRGQEVVDENEDLKEQVEECDQCKADVIAKLQEYDPDFDPQTCEDIVDKIDEIEEEAEKPDKYTFEPNPDDPDFPDDIMVIANGADVTDETTGVTLGVEITLDEQNRGTAYPYYISGGTKHYMGGVRANFVSYWGEHNIKVIDPTTGEFSGGARAYWIYGGSSWYPFSGTRAELIGYGDPTHSYTISK